MMSYLQLISSQLPGAKGIAPSPDGSVVIAKWDASKMKIYSIDGEQKCSVETSKGQPLHPWQAVVNSENNI